MRVEVRLTAQEKLKLKAKASIAGIGLSSYLRDSAFGRRIRSKTDIASYRQLLKLHVRLESLDPLDHEELNNILGLVKQAALSLVK